MTSAPFKFFPVAGADSELEDAVITDNIPTAVKNAGVGERRAKIIVAQVGMSVKVNDMHIGEFFGNRAKCAQSDKMFSAQHKGAFVRGQDLTGLLGDCL